MEGPELLDYILANTEVTPTGCREWQGPRFRQKEQYGKIKVRGQPRPVHREVLRLSAGEPPSPDHKALHSCDNPPCCEPTHLSWGTQKENVADCIAKGRFFYRHGKRTA